MKFFSLMQSFIKASSVVYWGFNACKHHSWNLYVSTFSSSTSLLQQTHLRKKIKKVKLLILSHHSGLSSECQNWDSSAAHFTSTQNCSQSLKYSVKFYLWNSKCSVRGGTLFKEDFDWLNFSLKATNPWLLFCLCVETFHLVLYLR